LLSELPPRIVAMLLAPFFREALQIFIDPVRHHDRQLDQLVTKLSVLAFDAAALEAVRQWRYEPTGLPNAVTLTVPVNFAPPR